MSTTLVILTCSLLIPGWFVLAITGLWRRWPGLGMWIVATGIGMAAYPVLFYAARSILPSFTLGPYKIGALLLLLAAMTVWMVRRDWRSIIAFHPLEWVALGVFALTLWTRFWIVRDHPYPAWSDSLHHALLTQLTAVQGRLPTTLEPYFPVPLDQYHLGLYAITAVTQWLAQVPAHTALLATAQVFNGLVGIGVYLVLDRKVGRVGAIVGALVVGLLSQQPALYVNWGRFTQLSSQTLLPIGWLVVWETLEQWAALGSEKQPGQPGSASSTVAAAETQGEVRLWYGRRKVLELLGSSIVAALLTAAVFLLHFRVAAFYLPLLGLSTVWVLWRTRQDARTFRRVLAGVVVIAALSLLWVLPALVDALRHYIVERLEATAVLSERGGTTVSSFYEFPLAAFPYLIGFPWWFLGLCAVGALVGVVRRNVVVVQVLLWVPMIVALGYAYLLRIPMLNLTNLGAVLIMFYLPIGLIAGSAVEEIAAGFARKKPVLWVALSIFLVAGLATARDRTLTLEPFRYFVTASDVAAMQWIKDNTPGDALFAVNTYFWLPNAPHGTDGGYWIPYFTGRPTTTGVMINNLAPQTYQNAIVEKSQAVERLARDPTSLEELRQLGVDYIYVGPMGNFAAENLDPVKIGSLAGIEEVYAWEGVYIFSLGTDGEAISYAVGTEKLSP